ncbi:polymorphic toxin-type HINT domain-containing protein [Streptomyces ossamyceticus]|uniref:polymorphic toxin-type HINT domain-containing protein n=1 Tax=Streptomyces ossamyceticus TaxID=249581 RepID=UPI0036EFD76E
MTSRRRRRTGRPWRQVALATAAVLTGTLIQAAGAPAVAQAWHKPALPKAEKPVAGGPAGKAVPRKVMKGPRTLAEAPATAWPKATAATVTLGEDATQVKGTPLSLDTRGTKAKDAADGSYTVRVLSRKAARKTGVDGPVFTLTPGKGGSRRAGKVRAGLDYSSFAGLYGGGYASRLTLVELPACALTTPQKKQCRTTRQVTTVNDTEKRTLTAKSVTLGSGAPTVLAAVADTKSVGSDYKASPLSPSAAWNTNLNTGDFTWSYEMAVPEVPGGLKPNVGMTYSSASVDGRTGNTNNQASWLGDGFDLWPGYIERRYKQCDDDGAENVDGGKPGDLCWAYDNAFLNFNGKAGELVPDGANSWKLKKDDGTRVARIYGSADNVRSNGARNDEYWRVTAPDGTRYYFGYNRLPGWADGKETTDSTWTVPVFGNNADEPCNASTFAASWCQQGWRWNLDYVVDARGNAIAYYYDKETNSYGRNLKAADDTRYVRGGTLDRIEYGLKSNAMYSAKALAKADFTNSERCIPNAQTDCDSIANDAAYWYDTPWDLNCDAGTDCDAGRYSPVYFTRKRLTQVSTQVYDGSAYKDVDSWKLTHRWGMADTDYQLLLDSVQRTGHTATPAITLPKTTFAYKQLANRLDRTGDGYAPFIKSRLSTIADESGGQTDVNYSAPVCDAAALPTPQTNTTRCFPQYIGGSSTADPELQWFNKYVVDSVTATDRTGGSPDQVITYDYKDGAAWHFDDDDGLTKEKHKTWSQWRGYGHVRVQTGGQGGASAMRTQEDTYFLRGMDGDRKDGSGGTRSVSVSLGEGEGDPITDHESAAGFAYRTVAFSGPGGKVLAKTVNRPWHHETAKKTRDWGTVTANLTGTGHTRTFTSLDDGAGASWRTTSLATTHDTVAGRVTQVDDSGDNATATDNTCTTTTYATNTTDNILNFPSRVETVAKSCGATVSRPADVISDVRSAYDGATYGAAPTKGDLTATAVLKKYDGTTAVYLESGATFDSYARPLTSTDLTADVKVTATGVLTRTARGDGRTTTTAYSPATGFATSTKVTSPPATAGDATTALSSTTTYDILRGQPLTQTDTNTKVTNLAYDALGRSSKVWLADRTTGQTPSFEFTYTIADGKPAAVGTKTLGNGGAQRTSYVLYDGFLRQRQTQEPGPDGGSLLADTFYDERGLVSKEFASYYADVAPSTTLFKPENALSVETQNRYVHDGLGRQTEMRQLAGNGDGSAVLGVTKTLYGGDRTTVVPPVGGVATTRVTDARGRLSELRQHHSRSATAAYDTTKYGYTAGGKLEKVTDPAGNTWEYQYDLLGRQTKAVDPDKGTTFSAYDDRGRLTTTDDARPDAESPALWYGYDNLGRRTEIREGSSGGALRAKWVYDTVSGAKGQLAESIRYSGGNAYSSKVVAYDRLYRPLRTSVTVPASEGALQGTYLASTTYNVSGTVQGVGYPKAGSLPAATVAFTYEDETLRLTGVDGSQGLKSTTSYSLTGKPLQYGLSYSGGKKTWATNTYEWGTQRLATSRVDREDVAGVDQHNTFRYDEAGNVLSVSDVSRSGTDTQCFTYDYLRRMTEAWTQSATGCATAPSAGVLGGPAPYWHSYTYDKVGNRQHETIHDTTGDTAKDTKRAYDYPDPGTAQPHTLRSVVTTDATGTAKDSYGYDETGNTETRTLNGDTQTLTWDAEGHLAKVTEPVEGGSSKVTEYLYDAEGNRLVGRTPTETTLYLGSTEITLAKGSTTAKATRYFDLGGGHQGVQKDDGSVSITLADHHGTSQLAVDTATQQLTQRRTLPFGGPRGNQPANWPGTKGFVGGTDDTKVTGLTHIGAREYDPSIGRFISVDPVMDLTDAQQMHGYTYSNNNPVTFSDPTGLWCDSCNDGKGWPTADGYEGASKTTTKSTSKKSSNNDSVWISQHAPTTSDQDNLDAWFSEYSPSGRAPDGDYWSTPIIQDDGSRGQACFGRLACLKANNYLTGLGRKLTDADYTKAKRIAATYCLDNASKCVDDAEAWERGKVIQDLIAMAFTGGKGGRVVKSLGGCKCFLAGTDVLMADGTTEDIEDIELGDEVMATDPRTGESGPRKVTRLIVTEDDKHFNELSIATEDGVEKLTATHEHPFWSPSERDWIEAADLTAGMTLLTDTGDTVVVTANRSFIERARTYNLTVAGLHTYFVLAGETPVLVHNASCWTATADKTSMQNALGHWRKHKADYPALQNAKQYVDSARRFMNSQDPWIQTKVRANGDIVRYNRATEDFGIMTPDGSIRTYYKPDPRNHGYASNQDYFDAQ